MSSSSPSDLQEPLAKRLAGLAAERRRDIPPGGVVMALRTVQQVTVSRGRFGASWSQRLVMAKWVLSGSAIMEVSGRRMSFGPGQVAIYMPTIPHRFWAVEPTNEMCWFTTDGPYAEQVVLELGLKPGIYAVPPPASEDLREMAASLKDSSLEGRRRSSLMAIAAWYRIADAIRTELPIDLVGRIRHLISQEFADPGLSISGIAKRVGYHRASLSRLFRQETGETIIAHLTQARLREARALLANTGERVAVVARQCGFSQSAYFCRWFRTHAGASPGTFRSARVRRPARSPPLGGQGARGA